VNPLEQRAEFFKALAHPSRILIVNLCRAKPRHTEELAHLLQLTSGTTSHHLKLLENAGILRATREGHYQNYAVQRASLEPSIEALLDLPLPEPTHDDPWKQKVLRDFMQRGRLKTIPVQRKKRDVILEFLARRFEPSTRYPEREVNVILEEYHEDSATLRRELIGSGLLQREAGVYWKV
jgi:ArsR family transcriptional regulator, arsenate/arsenite/antimonite-responsive transcriptional repressor